MENKVYLVDYYYEKEILLFTLSFFKKLEYYKKVVLKEEILSYLEKLSKNLLEQFSQLLPIIEVQDNVK